MPMTCKYDCGRQVDIGFSEADSCKNIHTENVYTIILMSKGSLTLRINGKRVKGNAPCVWALKENLDVEFVSSKAISAQSIHFDVAFLYRSVTFEKINSRKYEKSMHELNLVPLNAFYDYPMFFPMCCRCLKRNAYMPTVFLQIFTTPHLINRMSVGHVRREQT